MTSAAVTGGWGGKECNHWVRSSYCIVLAALIAPLHSQDKSRVLQWLTHLQIVPINDETITNYVLDRKT
jgi:hypothetical protein